MENYFGITYEFDKALVRTQIDDRVQSGQKGYVCVADGVTLAMSQKNASLKQVLDRSALTICDSGWVPSYLHFLYGIVREQYTGSDLLEDLVNKQSYRMMFLGASDGILEALRANLSQKDERIASMPFVSLPFLNVTDFDYPKIAKQIEKESPDIIWVSLGMPKQEFFMSRLEHFLQKGVLIGVGAAFKFHSGLQDHRRAPRWMIRFKLEWLHRIFREPGKQISRCWLIIQTMPVAFLKEYKRKQNRTQ